MTDYVSDFVQESDEQITALNNALLTLERNPEDDEAMENIFRIAHTIKGNCSAMGLESASDLAHAIEDLLDAVRSGNLAVTSELMDVVFDAVDELETMVAEVEATGEIETDPSATIEALREQLDEPSGPPSIEPPTADEIDAVLSRFEPPADDEHDAYLARLAITPHEEINNGALVVEALIDAFDLIGTDPPRSRIDADDYGGSFDAVFGSAVGEAAIESGLEPVDEVADFELVVVTDRFEALDAEAAAADPADADAGDEISPADAQSLEVDELLDEFDEFDDLDEKVEELADEDLEPFDDMGDAGSFDDLLDEESDAEPDTSRVEAGGVGSDPVDGSTDEPSAAGADAPDDEVDDAGAVFEELKEEVEMVGFDELQDELAELEFDEFDDEEEVDMDELLGDDVDLDDDSFLESEPSDDAIDDVLYEDDFETATGDAADSADTPETDTVEDPDIAFDEDDPIALGATDDADETTETDADGDLDAADDADEESIEDAEEQVEGEDVDEEEVEDEDIDEEQVEDEDAIDDDGYAVEPVTDAIGGESDPVDGEPAVGSADGEPAVEPADGEADDDAIDAAIEAVDVPEPGVDADDETTSDEADDDASDDEVPVDDAEEPAADDEVPEEDAEESAADDDVPVVEENEGDEQIADEPDDGPSETDDAIDEPVESQAADEELDAAAEADDPSDAAPEFDEEPIARVGDEPDTAGDDEFDAVDDAEKSVEGDAIDSDAEASEVAEAGANDGAVDDEEADDEATAADDGFDGDEFGDDGFDDAGGEFADDSFADDGFDEEDGFDAEETASDDSFGTDVDADDSAFGAQDASIDDEFGDESFGATDADAENSDVGAIDPADLEIDDEQADSFGDEFGSTALADDQLDDPVGADAFDVGESSIEGDDPVDAFGDDAVDTGDDGVVRIVDEPELEIPDVTVPEPSDRPDADEQTDEIQSVRVDVDQIDSLLTLVEGLVTSRVRLRHAIEEGEDLQAIAAELDDLEDLTTDLQETVMDIRLVPLNTVANRLPRVVRDIAREQDKAVAFEMTGEDVELDRSILDRIGDPLIHLVRNAVDHGIEPPEEREAADKPREGTVAVTADRSRDRVRITVSDDGSGLDPDRLRSEAVEAGVLTEDAAADLSDEEAFDLIFHPGLSTADEVTDVSGRGVGMDVVERTIENLDGTLEIDSEPGAGTTVTMTLPVTVAIDDILFVECGGEEFGVPTKAVDDIESATSVETVDGEPVLPDEDGDCPVLDLDEALDTPRAGANGDGMVVRIRDEVRPIALHCDHVHGQQEVVVKPFEGFMSGIPGLSGATVRGRGEVVNILDVTTL